MSGRGRGRAEACGVLAWLCAAAGRGGLWLVGALCAAQAAMACLAVALAPLMRQAVDAASAREAGAFWRAAAPILLILVAQVAMSAWVRYGTERARAHVDNALRVRAFDAVLAMPQRTAEGWHTADLMGRMTADVEVVSGAAVALPAQVFSLGIRLVGAFVVMALIAPQVAGVFAVLGCLGLTASAALRGPLQRRHRTVQEAESRVRSVIQDCLEGLLVIRVFGAGARERERVGRAMDGHRSARMRRAALANLGSTGFAATMQAGYALGFVWCAWQLLEGSLTAGGLVAVVQLVGQLVSPLSGLGGIAARWAQLVASAGRLREVEAAGRAEGAARAEDPDAPAEAAQGPVPADAEAFYSQLEALELRDVTFAYGAGAPTDALGTPVLSGFNARVAKGEPTALAGPSGRGKSTLFKLLLGVYQPVRGSVAYVGRSPEGECWRCPAALAPVGVAAYVPQGNALMADTVERAVALACQGEPDPARLREALVAACADEFVAALPLGAETPLGERGAGLSEGQLQRLAVARAVYSAAPVILLDEATSALDAPTEARMLERLLALPGRTVVMASHRVSALERFTCTIDLGTREDR